MYNIKVRQIYKSEGKYYMKKFLAFTLAETLIVMGIIGIVSALTLPNLNSSTGEKEKVAKVKKIYQSSFLIFWLFRVRNILELIEI